MSTEEYAESVLDLVEQIPAGRVLTYGDVAEILGAGGPRNVGAVMSRYGSDVPWWRVIRADGTAPEPLAEQARAHWLAEGMPLIGGPVSGRRVDMRAARWEGPTARAGEPGDESE